MIKDARRMENSELEKVTGGAITFEKIGMMVKRGGTGSNGTSNGTANAQLMRVCCPYPDCGEFFMANVMKNAVKCPGCQRNIILNG